MMVLDRTNLNFSGSYFVFTLPPYSLSTWLNEATHVICSGKKYIYIYLWHIPRLPAGAAVGLWTDKVAFCILRTGILWAWLAGLRPLQLLPASVTGAEKTVYPPGQVVVPVWVSARDTGNRTVHGASHESWLLSAWWSVHRRKGENPKPIKSH